MALSALSSSALLWQQDSLDVGQDSALGNGHSSQQLVQLLVIADGELRTLRSREPNGQLRENVYLQMSGNDPGLFVVPGSVAGQLEDLCGQVLHDGGEVDRGSGSHTLGVVSLAEKSGRE